MPCNTPLYTRKQLDLHKQIRKREYSGEVEGFAYDLQQDHGFDFRRRKLNLLIKEIVPKPMFSATLLLSNEQGRTFLLLSSVHYMRLVDVATCLAQSET